ncbi:MAG TPA: site-2 protease family protein [Terriglobales bacterium]|nr:site-2 protease family protein [Terriglobales bacterium]
MNILSIVLQVFVVLFAITVHEAAHGWAALKMGDPTAYAAGRVTLNPLAHIDLIGTVLLPLVLILAHQPVFGWAKPVPVNPHNLRHPRKDSLWISLAGPAANLATAAVSLVLLRLTLRLAAGMPAASMWAKSVGGLAQLLYMAVMINLALAVFNLIPIPPLDGSGILAGLLPEQAAAQYERLRPYGFILLIILVYTNVLNSIFNPIQSLVLRLLR